MIKTENKLVENPILTTVLFLYMAYNLLPVITRLVDVRIYLIILAVLYTLLLVTNFKKMDRILLIFVALLPIFSLTLFFKLRIGDNINNIIVDSATYFLPPFISYTLLRNLRKNSITAKYILIFFVITSITTIIGLFLFPDASRWLAGSASGSDDPYLITLDMHNIGGYYFIYFLVILYPMIISMYKHKVISFLSFIIIAGLFAITMIKSEYTTAIIFFVFTSLLVFVPKSQTKIFRYILISILILVPFVIMGHDLISDFLFWISRFSKSNEISMRLNMIADFFKGDTSSFIRLQLYEYDINVFLRYPLFGSMISANAENSYHSFVLNTLALYGVIGVASLLIYYVSIYKFFYRNYRNTSHFKYALFSFLISILLSILNSGSWLFMLSLIIPVFSKYIYDRTQKERPYS